MFNNRGGYTRGIFCVILFLFLCGALYDFDYKMDRLIKDEVYNALVQNVDNHRSTLTAKLDGLFELLNTWGDYIVTSETEWDERQITALMQSVIGRAEFRRMGIGDTQGFCITNDGIRLTNADREFYRRALEGKEVISEPLESKIDGQTVVMLAVPLIKDGKILGSLYAAFDQKQLADSLYTETFNGKGTSFVTDAEGNIITGKGFWEEENTNIFRLNRSVELINTTSGEVRRLMLENQSGTLEYRNQENRYLCLFEPLTINDWYLFSSVPEEVIAGQAGNIKSQGILLLVKMVVCFSGFTVILLTVYRKENRRILESREKLKESEQRYRILFEQSDNILFEIGMEEQVVEFSNNFYEKFGYTVGMDYHLKKSWGKALLHVEDRNKLDRCLEEMKTGARQEQVDMRIRKADGEYLWCRVLYSPIKDEKGRLVKVFGKIEDIDGERKERERLKQAALKDPLSGLLNKTATERMIEDFLAAEGNAESHALLLLDLDNFKGINDNFGHMAGDQAIRGISAGIRRMFRNTDILGRIGGDEFVIFLKYCGRDKAIEKAEELELLLKRFQVGNGREWTVSGSIGIALTGAGNDTFETLYKEADQAMYDAKRTGKNQYKIYLQKGTGRKDG